MWTKVNEFPVNDNGGALDNVVCGTVGGGVCRAVGA